MNMQETTTRAANDMIKRESETPGQAKGKADAKAKTMARAMARVRGGRWGKREGESERGHLCRQAGWLADGCAGTQSVPTCCMCS